MKTKARNKVTTQHSRYWIDEDLFSDDVNADVDDKHTQNITKIIRLSAVRRAISNFVSILCGQNIPVKFNDGGDSYTDGENVVIGADDNSKNFDVMVGLALHEGSHVLLTDFKFLKNIIVPIISNSYINSVSPTGIWSEGRVSSPDRLTPIGAYYLHPELYNKIGPKLIEHNFVIAEMFSDIKTIMNVLEDRRIDAFVYKTAKGYRPYYTALYEKYFLHKEIGKGIKHNPDWREPTIRNYINQLILSIHPDFDPDAMLGLRKIVGMMDLKNINRVAPQNDAKGENGKPLWHTAASFEATPVLWQEASRIYAEILNQVELNFSPESKTETGNGEGVGGGEGNGEGEVESEKQEEVTQASEGKFNPSAGNKALDTLTSMVNGDVKKKKVTQRQKQTLDSIEKSDATVETANVDNHGPVETLVVRKLTADLLAQDWFPLYRSRSDYYAEYVAAGRRMGAVMTSRLQLRNDPLYTKNTRLNQGKIDRRLLANLGMDIDSVFYKDRVDTHRPAMLHLSIDASGSMRGKPWGQALTVATAIAYVSSKISNVDAVISLRVATEALPVTVIAFDSRKDNFTNFVNVISQVEVSSSTPEGLCFEAVQGIILDSKDTHDVYFINFSDGMPGFSARAGSTHFYYAGELAYDHTRKMVNKFRENGVKVLSYYIESDGWNADGVKKIFKRMYGEDASFIDVSNVTQVLGTLNRRLAVR
jgi:hypothetical protein